MLFSNIITCVLSFLHQTSFPTRWSLQHIYMGSMAEYLLRSRCYSSILSVVWSNYIQYTLFLHFYLSMPVLNIDLLDTTRITHRSLISSDKTCKNYIKPKLMAHENGNKYTLVIKMKKTLRRRKSMWLD